MTDLTPVSTTVFCSCGKITSVKWDRVSQRLIAQAIGWIFTGHNGWTCGRAGHREFTARESLRWRESKPDGFLSNILAVNVVHARQAAIDRRMPVSIGEAVPGYENCVGVYTEQPRLDHGPFWERYFELSRAALSND